jgi:hypothetical protein
MLRRSAPLAALILLAASCGGGSGTPVAVQSPSPVEGALTQGLIAYVASTGVGVLDPATGKATVVALSAGALPVFGATAGHPLQASTYPVLSRSKTIGGREPEIEWRRAIRLVVPSRPFAGVTTPLGASFDIQSEVHSGWPPTTTTSRSRSGAARPTRSIPWTSPNRRLPSGSRPSRPPRPRCSPKGPSPAIADWSPCGHSRPVCGTG